MFDHFGFCIMFALQLGVARVKGYFKDVSECGEEKMFIPVMPFDFCEVYLYSFQPIQSFVHYQFNCVAALSQASHVVVNDQLAS